MFLCTQVIDCQAAAFTSTDVPSPVLVVPLINLIIFIRIRAELDLSCEITPRTRLARLFATARPYIDSPA